MIQRQQSLWLLLAAVASFFSFRYPFYTGNRMENNTSLFAELEAGSNFFLLILTGISILLAVITIFIYKDRKTQLKLAIGGIVLSILLLILYFTEIQKFDNGNFALTALWVVAIPAGYILAARGIWKDQKLVKSLDKLR
jgi:C4-dicarboxylate transporter